MIPDACLSTLLKQKVISFKTTAGTVTGCQRLISSLLEYAAAAAAAKSLQSCPTLCDPMDGSQPGSPVPGIFQARVLE